MLGFSKKYDAYILLAGAAFLMWFGGYLREPNYADKRFLVAAEGIEQKPFDRAVLFVQRHDGEGADALIINKSSDDPGFALGGPVETDKLFALYTPDVEVPGGTIYEELSIGVGRERAVEYLQGEGPKPKWYVLLKGYAGWYPTQLEDEIRKGAWKVVEYDFDLLTKTSREKVWEEANARPAAELKPKDLPAEPKPEPKGREY